MVVALLQAANSASYLLLIMYSVNNMVRALGAGTIMVGNMDCNTFVDSLFIATAITEDLQLQAFVKVYIQSIKLLSHLYSV